MIEAANWKLIDPASWRWPHFSPEEMACKGDGSLKMDEAFLDRLESLRAMLGFPMIVSSGYRSPAHNALVSHTGEDGPHTMGHATDLLMGGVQVFKVLDVAGQLGFTGIGLSQKGDFNSRFIHLDDLSAAESQPRPWCWTY